MTELSQKFSEATTAVGVTSSGELLEVLTSADRSTWSIVLSRPGGVSCIVAVGEEWQERRTLARQERMM